MQQLGQFGEENKHFLPVLGLAARQPASSGFLGLLGWGGGGGAGASGVLRADSSPLPWEGGRRGQWQSGQAQLRAGSPCELLGFTPGPSPPCTALCFLGRSPAVTRILGSLFGFPLL